MSYLFVNINNITNVSRTYGELYMENIECDLGTIQDLYVPY